MQNKPENRVPAGFWVRFAAYLVDSVIIGAGILLVRIPIWISSLMSPGNPLVMDVIFQYSIADIVLYVLKVSYFILLTYFTGATLGKRLFQIRVYSKDDRKLTLFEVVFRETIGRFLSALFLQVGYLMVGIQKEKRGLHDLLSDTEVLYCHCRQVATEPPVVEKQVEAQNYEATDYRDL